VSRVLTTGSTVSAMDLLNLFFGKGGPLLIRCASLHRQGLGPACEWANCLLNIGLMQVLCAKGIITKTWRGRPLDCSASFSNPMMEGPGTDSEEKHAPVSDIHTVAVDSLIALDPQRRI